MAKIEIQLAVELSDSDIGDMCDAAETAILDGGGFGWLKPPPRAVLERYWRGVLLVPERILVVGRRDGRIAGLAQLVLPPRNNEAQSRIATITSNFVAPWARGMGMARGITATCERAARQHKMQFINLDVRETQDAAIQLYETLGYERWGTNPNYAIVQGRVVAGHYYTKPLGRRARKEPPERKQEPKQELKDDKKS
jgi:ribosomal protein S18 acetylase RimI-like enzyme